MLPQSDHESNIGGLSKKTGQTSQLRERQQERKQRLFVTIFLYTIAIIRSYQWFHALLFLVKELFCSNPQNKLPFSTSHLRPTSKEKI